MNISTTFKFSITLTSVILLLTACGKHDGIVDDGPAKSVNYYFAHHDEAKKAADRCVAFDRNEFSQMGPSRQDAWQETTAGINCKNSKFAYAMILQSEYQQNLMESDKKLMSQ